MQNLLSNKKPPNRNEVLKLIIKKILNRIFPKSVWNILIRKYRLRQKNRYFNEIRKRQNVDIFDYKILSRRVNCYLLSTERENISYGHGSAIFPKLGINSSKQFDYCIEHGLSFGTLIGKTVKETTANTIITFSEYRKKIIQRKINKNVICVGPYIQCCEELHSRDELDKLKIKLGKTLLVFPAHSIDTAHSQYDLHKFLDFLKSYTSNNYNTVLVCLYWKDIEMGRAEHYEALGFRVVTAGYIYDTNFVRRLKSIIYLADKTVSNAIGTHIGYCVAMGKPHQYIDADYFYTETEVEGSKEEINIRKGVDKDTAEKAIKEIAQVFSNGGDKITEEQTYCVQKYWGKWE